MAKRVILENYAFNPSSKTITVNGKWIRPEQLLLITNVTNNTVLYNFSDPSLGATISNTFSPANPATGIGTISGNTLTINTVSAGSGNVLAGSFGVGQTIAGPGVLPGTMIIALGTGTGGSGTYTLNRSYSSSMSVAAGSFIIGNSYTITSVGSTNFTLIGASTNTVGTTFTATGPGSGTGVASGNQVISAAVTISCVAYGTEQTVIVLTGYDTSLQSATDKLSILVEEINETLQPSETLLDPVGKMRTSSPQALIDTDFEYGTQPTKWESVWTQNMRPSAFYDATSTISGITNLSSLGNTVTAFTTPTTFIGYVSQAASPNTSILSVTNITYGSIGIGMNIMGPSIGGNVIQITGQLTGSPGGIGTYSTSASLGSPLTQSVMHGLYVGGASASASISNNILTINSVASGSFAPGQHIFGPNVTQGTFILGQLTGTGQVGTYVVGNANNYQFYNSNSTLTNGTVTAAASTTVTGTNTFFTQAMTGGYLYSGSVSVQITGVTSATSITVASSVTLSSAAFIVAYPSGSLLTTSTTATYPGSANAAVGAVYSTTVAIGQPIFVSGTYDAGNADGWWIVDAIQPSTNVQVANAGGSVTFTQSAVAGANVTATASGTFFTPQMVGGMLIWGNSAAQQATIVAYVSTTAVILSYAPQVSGATSFIVQYGLGASSFTFKTINSPTNFSLAPLSTIGSTQANISAGTNAGLLNITVTAASGAPSINAATFAPGTYVSGGSTAANTMITYSPQWLVNTGITAGNTGTVSNIITAASGTPFTAAMVGGIFIWSGGSAQIVSWTSSTVITIDTWIPITNASTWAIIYTPSLLSGTGNFTVNYAQAATVTSPVFSSLFDVTKTYIFGGQFYSGAGLPLASNTPIAASNVNQYTTGTITTSGFSNLVTGSGTTFTSQMVGGILRTSVVSQYSTGTVSSASTTVTGSGTTFDSRMIGGTLTWGNGLYSAIITEVASTTSLTIATAPSIAIPASSSYVIVYPITSYSTKVIGYLSATTIVVENYINIPSATSYTLSYSANVFSATMSGNTLTVTGVTSGTVALGAGVSGPGIPEGTQILAWNATNSAYSGTGTTGTYLVSTSATITTAVQIQTGFWTITTLNPHNMTVGNQLYLSNLLLGSRVFTTTAPVWDTPTRNTLRVPIALMAPDPTFPFVQSTQVTGSFAGSVFTVAANTPPTAGIGVLSGTQFDPSSTVAPMTIINGAELGFYNAGTITASGSTTVTGTSTAFTVSMIGGTLYSGTNVVTITAVASATSLTVSSAITVSGAVYHIVYPISSGVSGPYQTNVSQFLSSATYNLGQFFTSVYPRQQGFVIHRAFDGGVQFSNQNSNHNQQLARQTRRYFRYQSGKGIQFSTGSIMKPSLQVDTVTSSGTTVTVTCKYPHGLSTGTQIIVSGADQSAYNGTFNVATAPSQLSITYIALSTPSTSPATATFPNNITIAPFSWYGSANRIGYFDLQNGAFFEFDGQTLWAVRRSSTFQVQGNISVQPMSAKVYGTNTAFLSQLNPGDFVVIRGQSYIVTGVQSNTQLTISPEYRSAFVVNQGIMSKTIDTKVPQSAWNIDRMDGTGSSGFNIDLTRMQMFYIDYAWYGAGTIRWGFKNSRGEVMYAHRMMNNNVNTEAYMRSGNLPGRYETNTFGPQTILSTTLANSTVGPTGTLSVADASLFPNSGTIIVEDPATNGAIEYINYSAKSGNTLTIASTGPLSNGRGNYGGSSTAQTFTVSGNNASTNKPTSLYAVKLHSPAQSSTISHWGSSVIMDGRYDDDKSLVFNVGMNTALTIPTTTTRAPLISLRISPSVDNGFTSIMGAREILNRMQLVIRSIDASTTQILRVEIILNAVHRTGRTWLPVGGSSLAQYALHGSSDTISGGESIASFFTAANTVTQQDLALVRDLGNSILGGGTNASLPTSAQNKYPDGPDVITLVATAVGTAGNINARISWTEAQA